jgi:hypothetical protein
VSISVSLVRPTLRGHEIFRFRCLFVV